MLKITEEIRHRNFFHLQVGGVYRGKQLMSKSFVQDPSGGVLLRWCKVLKDRTLEKI